MSSSSAQLVITELCRRSETVATAESLTGGLLGGMLTAAPGASAAYVGGVISYATRLKGSLVGVDPTTLAEFGPVAGPTAAEMAAGVCRTCDADWGVATTGVAGPEPQDGHPVGEVYVAVAHPSSGLVEVRELRLAGDRPTIRAATVSHALDLLAGCLTVPVRSQESVGPIPPDSVWTPD
jgi:nicotinamide-nucleotide amidase